MMQSVANAFLPAILPIVERRKGMAYASANRDFHLYRRRGRYVEFNLVWDRGTPLWPAIGGTHRGDSDVHATVGELVLPAPVRGRIAEERFNPIF